MIKLLFAILFATPFSASADADNLTFERMCQAAAIESSKLYAVMGELVAKDPRENPKNIARKLIQASYEKTKSTKLQMQGAEKLLDTIQLWREFGVNSYLRNPNYSELEFERLAYQICTKPDPK